VSVVAARRIDNMTNDFLDRLADFDVPPPPTGFDGQLHDRMNRALLSQQIVELLCGALPAVMWEFARALKAALRFTLSGKYEGTRRRRFR
jgi:hypothetical protein